jgi:hypothetical protein
VWDPDLPGQALEVGKHDGPVWAVAVLGDDRIVAGGDGGQVRAWRADDPGQALELGEVDGPVTALTALDDIWVLASGGSDLRVFDPDRPGSPIAEMRINVEDLTPYVTQDEDGPRVAVLHSDGLSILQLAENPNASVS